MVFEQSWRWYGPEDPVSLPDIKQAGAHGVVTALHHIPVGEIWSEEEIQKRKQFIEASNEDLPLRLHWNVVESLPVHEHIKQGKDDRDEYIKNYLISLKNLAQQGITRVCYNFMPVLDWLRTNVQYELEDGSKALRHDITDLAIFDIYILKRNGAESSYSDDIVAAAKKKYNAINPEELEKIRKSLLMALPGDKEGFTIQKLRNGLAQYSDISAEDLRENLIYFLKAVIPAAEEMGLKMAIHPDDPPWPVLGLPRVVSNEGDLDYIFEQVPQLSNGLTFCSGSLGASDKNDLPVIIEKYFDRIHFVHLRSVQRTEPYVFYEADHLKGNAEMYDLIKTFSINQKKNKTSPIPMRPDHGHQMLEDIKKTYYPGYSVIGRLRGLAELRGLEFGIVKSMEEGK